jgi:hypothetical protein
VSKRFVTVILGTGIGAALAGCATGNGEAPLVFGSTNVLGVSIGGSVADTGGEFVVGYKGLDLAVIPVSAVQSGTEKFIGATAGSGHADSYSVIGQFSAEAGRSADGANAGLGKFFATGIAARNIASGFARKMGAYGRTSVSGCGPGAPVSADEVKQALGKLEQKIDQHAAGNAPASAASAAERQSPEILPGPSAKAVEARPGARLIFAQYNYKAVAIDGSAFDSSIKLTLGVRDRNIAFIPMIGRDASGNLVWLESRNPAGGDVLSVLGQFKSDDSIQPQASDRSELVKTADGAQDPAPKARGISSGLEKFFSTGGAAVTLSEGFRVKLCEEYAASSARQTAPQPAPGEGNRQTEAPSPQPAKLVAPEALR